ncbi:hypothetical protein IFU37_023430 (plasmid) [Pantoea agglomerans]|uniref:hypothetical protein n=1 Tax=Enterobacter agglomerans TaxID=549 RepID=UPI00177F5E8E|nr:hypothetical protein [Pantoea agglomerans]WVL92394.1 hypothetical protein IFU37_023430 [Pantoea agglomerans]
MVILPDRSDGTMEAHAKKMTGLLARRDMDWKRFKNDIIDNHVFAALEDELFILITRWETWRNHPTSRSCWG